FETSTRCLEEADSTFAPVEGMFTVSNQVAHAAQTIDWYFEGAFSPEGFDLDFPAHEAQVRRVNTLSHAREWFSNAIRRGIEKIETTTETDWSELIAAGPIMNGMPRSAILRGIVDHTAHHRGALTVYSR